MVLVRELWVVCLESVGGFEKQNHHKIFAILTLFLFQTFSRSLLYSCNCYVKEQKTENSHNSKNVVVGKGTREEKKGWFACVGGCCIEMTKKRSAKGKK